MADNAPTPTPAPINPATASLDDINAALAEMDSLSGPADPAPENNPQPSAEPTNPQPPSDPADPANPADPADPAPELDPEPPEDPEPKADPDPAAAKPGATPPAARPPQYRIRPQNETDEKILALTKAGYSLAEAAALVASKQAPAPAAPAAPKPAEPAAPPAPKPEEVRAQLTKAESALEQALDAGDTEAYNRAVAQIDELRVALPDAEIMRSLGAARKAAKTAEQNLDFTAQAQAEREAQKWQQALDAKRAQTREAQARDAQQKQNAHAQSVQASVAEAQEHYSFAKEGDSLFPKFEAFLEAAANSPRYANIIKSSTDWPVIMADVFAAQEGIARGAKQAAAPAPAPAAAPAARPKPATAPGTKAKLLTTGNAAAPAEAPSTEAATEQLLAKALAAKDPKELDKMLEQMSFDAPSGTRAVGF